MRRLNFIIATIILFFSTFSFGQFSSLTAVQDQAEGVHTFNFGNGNFQGYVDADGWMLWLQYHHEGGTSPGLNPISEGNNLPLFDNSPMGTDLSSDLTKWGHGGQSFAASIPDGELWLRWEAATAHHTRKIHFESPVLGTFQTDTADSFIPDIAFQFVPRPDHTANLPANASSTNRASTGNNALTGGPFLRFANNRWDIGTGDRWHVDNSKNEDGTNILEEHSTIHRVWVKPIPFNNTLLMTTFCNLQDHINGSQTLSATELDQIKNVLYLYAENITNSKALMEKALAVMDDFDAQIGPLFTTSNTVSGFPRDPLSDSAGRELERAIVALEQAIFDHIFTRDIWETCPHLIHDRKFKSCVAFPGDIAAPTDSSATYTVDIRANFEDPWGINPSYTINGDGTDHAFRPTGFYLAPGSFAKVTVPSAIVNKGYYIRVGVHEWDLGNKPNFKRLDRITKKFPIDSTTVTVFNPFGGAIGILVPLGATEGIVNIAADNIVEAPFYSIKSFYETADFEAELNKIAPWAVFETDNVMYTIPRHNIVPGAYDLRQTLADWDTGIKAINYILGRPATADKHDFYLINDVFIRGGAFSIGYPMSNSAINFASIPGNPQFIDGPSSKYHVLFHEYGHASRISKFAGEPEALVNFLYVMAMDYGLGEDLNLAHTGSFVPHTFDIDKTAIHRMASNTFGGERIIAGNTTNEVRYQHRGYGHYTEIVNLFDWCALRNFWLQENIDFENGIDHGINDQDQDSRIVRMSIAAETDLRPLFHFFGIIPKDAAMLDNQMLANNLTASRTLYNRLQEYKALLPADATAFQDYALSIYPTLLTSGPTANPDFGIGWFYLKSLSYDTSEKAAIEATLQSIIDLYFPSGAPSTDAKVSLDCLREQGNCSDGIDNDGNGEIDCEASVCTPTISLTSTVLPTCPNVKDGSITLLVNGDVSGAGIPKLSMDGGATYLLADPNDPTTYVINDLAAGAYSFQSYNEMTGCAASFNLTLDCIESDRQFTSLTAVQDQAEGVHTFNFGDGEFQGYVDADGWILWLQYHHQGGTSPRLNLISEGNNLPIFDNSPIETDLSSNLTKWGHGTQTFAASIPDAELWLRWEAETSHHTRKIHFESPVLGKFQSDTADSFTPEIASQFVPRPDHTANLPANASFTRAGSNGNNALIDGPFLRFANNRWDIGTGNRWHVDNAQNEDGTSILNEYSTIHRVWIKPIPSDIAGDTCPIALTVTENISVDSTLSASDTLYATNVIESSANVTYKAGHAVILQPNFEVKAGATFLATTKEACTNLPQSEQPLAERILQKEIDLTVSTPEIQLQVFPNPFTTATTIKYELPNPSAVQIQLYDMNGRLMQTLLTNTPQEAGNYQLNLDRKDLQVGMYYLNLRTDTEHLVKKVLIIK